jgi:nucleotide-binding universal stress UspA family protein
MANPLVVVGVDGSDGSKEALRWAAGYARQTGGRLHVVGVWRDPYVYYGYAASVFDADLSAETDSMVRKTIADVLGPESELPLEVEVLEGAPAEMLVEAAKSADLLVVGSRGHGAFAGMLLGSVSSHCVHNAHGPVVVVRPKTKTA